MTNLEKLMSDKRDIATLLATLQTDMMQREEMRYIPIRSYDKWLEWLDKDYDGWLN